jgi:diguanylate cyclase (GGDEF)-like protein/PAS domain S-box-containing protein
MLMGSVVAIVLVVISSVYVQHLRMISLAKKSNDSSVIFNKNKMILYANGGFCKLVEKDKDECIGENMETFFQNKLCLNLINNAIENEEFKGDVIDFIGDKNLRYSFKIFPYFSFWGSRFLGFVTQVRESNYEKALKKIASNTKDAFIITDNKGNIMEVNQAFCKMSGYSEKEVLYVAANFFSLDWYNQSFHDDFWHSIKTMGSWSGQVKNRRKNGRFIKKWLNVSSVKDEKDNFIGYVGVYSDLSSVQNDKEKAFFLKNYDALTGVLSKHYFLQRLERVVQRASYNNNFKAVSVIRININEFHKINEKYGYRFGDEVLINTAERLKKISSAEISIGRLGDDEFSIIIENSDVLQNVSAFCKKIVLELEKPIMFKGKVMNVSVYAGVSIFPMDSKDYHGLTNSLNQAIESAKKESSNTGKSEINFFNRYFAEDMKRKLSLVKDIKKAINEEAFYLVYEPQYNIKTQKVDTLRASVRWLHSTKGFVSPKDFMPVVEDAGYINILSKYLVCKACQQIKDWKNNPIMSQMKVCLKLSDRYAENLNFIDDIADITSFFRSERKQLELEINKFSTLENISKNKDALARLDNMGISLSLNDYAVCFSAKQSLEDLPIKSLKIKSYYINKAMTNKDDALIIKTAIALSNRNKISVIAKDVETKSQEEWVKKCGFNGIMGSVMASPATPEELEKTIELRFGKISA